MKPARVRFAPSPTGHMHLGSARTALYDFLFAKKIGGQFVLRIEDTDQKRFQEGAEQELIDGLHWLGLEWDEGPDKGGPYGPYRQSERKVIYQEFARKLIENGHAYYCFCTPERLQQVRETQMQNKQQSRYDGFCRDIPLEIADKRIINGESHVVRFRTPVEGFTTVTDLLRGDIIVENKNLDDYIIVKSDGLALYHLAAVIDDHLMEITHVLRGSEWLPTFPLHGLIHRAFGWQEPIWVHLSVFLKPSGKGKMSKREAADLVKDGKSIFVKELKNLGYLPEAVNNWVALMGWSYDDHTEFFSMEELIEKFSLEKLNPSPAAINFSKLDHFNGLHIRNLSIDELVFRLSPVFEEAGYIIYPDKLKRIAPIIQERLQTLDDAIALAGFFFKEDVYIQKSDLVMKNMTTEEIYSLLKEILTILSGMKSMEKEIVEPALRECVVQTGFKPAQVFGLLRIAITGLVVSPPLMESLEIIGKEKVIERVKKALDILSDKL
ncbi:MAG: glutamate--tRNA ligase [Chloroflexi bacterium HGW-Chloroflexi-10]|nr:MAG: glutamate--tRNA ligase [Chloroflexi bacterium HGW-Chloroflexi-10]